MPVIEYKGLKIDLDDEGYLVDYKKWNKKVACALAEKEGVSKQCPLTKEQIDILKFIRSYYEKYESVPIVRAVCKNVHQPKTCEYVQFADPLIACKIAGLPKLYTGYPLM